MTERLVECIVVTVKCSRYRPGVAQRVGGGLALLSHDRGTRRGWVVSSKKLENVKGKLLGRPESRWKKCKR